MRTSHYSRLAHQVQEQTTTLLQRQLCPRDFSRRCSATALLSCLVLAAAARIALSAVAFLRSRCPSRETLRQALLKTLPGYQELLQQTPYLLRASLPRSLRKRHRDRRRRYPLAIDLHAVPYYKRDRVPPAHVRKGKRLPGTAYSHQYATASLLRKGQYYVVSLTPYDPDEPLVKVVQRLLRQAAANGFSPRYVLMDRSFWSVEVFRYLQCARYPFLLPVLARGKKPTAPGGPSGTHVFLHGRCRTGWYTYRVHNREKSRSAVVTIAVHRRNYRGWRSRHGRYTWAYALWQVKLSTVQWVRQSYRRRFRIESSYKLLESCRGRTNSRDEGWRLWYVVLGALLLNHWLRLRHERCRQGVAALERWWKRLLLVLVFQLLCEPARPQSDDETTDRPPQQ
jgi:putative transposase